LVDPFPFSCINIERSGLSSPGIYAFYLNKTCIYVGSAERPLSDRLKEHWHGSHNKRLANWIKVYGKKLRIEIKEVSQIERVKHVEQSMIVRLSPLVNIIQARK
jgi:hypothetical protein